MFQVAIKNLSRPGAGISSALAEFETDSGTNSIFRVQE
jgi:hypothetical protein